MMLAGYPGWPFKTLAWSQNRACLHAGDLLYHIWGQAASHSRRQLTCCISTPSGILRWPFSERPLSFNWDYHEWGDSWFDFKVSSVHPYFSIDAFLFLLEVFSNFTAYNFFSDTLFWNNYGFTEVQKKYMGRSWSTLLPSSREPDMAKTLSPADPPPFRVLQSLLKT